MPETVREEPFVRLGPFQVSERTRRRIAAVALDPRNVATVLVALGVIAGVQQWLLGPKMMGGGLYTHWNNYRIYERSFLHLVQGKDLYLRYPLEHWDVFKYSPTFAAFMAPFSPLPDLLGIALWNVLNAAVLVLAIAKLPVLSDRSKALVGLLLVPDFLTAVQNTQANVLIAALLVLAYDLLEEDRPGWASLCVVAAAYIKVYPALGGLLFVLYPRKVRFVLSGAAWLVALGLLPLLLVPPRELVAQYANWARLLTSDRDVLTGLSVMGWLHSWFHLDPPKALVTAVGGIVGLLPLARVAARRRPEWRLLYLASLLVWMVIFNHTSESATFFIAMCGVALWYFARPRGPWGAALFVFAFLFTSMSPRFPGFVVDAIVQPYVLKAVPCIFVWIALVLELSSRRAPEPAALAAP